uniref:Uncharacterized protein n=1 Tax=Euplotes crassus TaxID=5936 RepID=A0A7S3KJ61_EUPCR|mmetsp:Transcript_30524/g.29989  ORF Transcript_30524/g.29989 Transcript_30524/m.29989 type:complete len:235 (+) Transcript_30524:604-1308(+)|eukprot:CAMPEP_0197005912 /NCGR_PEP_ID=MMETSP1380-20130617/32037_1 /TAXON_ID=5936 /ORGANISM="Euplotes crassus, Strain CT5" /LENGTH=234 /DNA_ID=CAMNT_0042425247 /DNA_START=604 /DNA_END=1308 /DNA_ORIENTATION=+
MTNNVVKRDYINNLITSSKESTNQMKRMTANEESKDGVSQIYNYEDQKQDDSISSFSFHKDPVKPQSRGPLYDATNKPTNVYEHQEYKKPSNNYTNPITGGYQEMEDTHANEKYNRFSRPKTTESEYKSIPAKITSEERKQYPTGEDLDNLIKQKEAELEEVMDRLSVCSKSSKAPKNSHEASFQNKPIDHTIPSAHTYERQAHVATQEAPRTMTAKEIKRTQFHSSAPWANYE